MPDLATLTTPLSDCVITGPGWVREWVSGKVYCNMIGYSLVHPQLVAN